MRSLFGLNWVPDAFGSGQLISHTAHPYHESHPVCRTTELALDQPASTLPWCKKPQRPDSHPQAHVITPRERTVE